MQIYTADRRGGACARPRETKKNPDRVRSGRESRELRIFCESIAGGLKSADRIPRDAEKPFFP